MIGDMESMQYLFEAQKKTCPSSKVLIYQYLSKRYQYFSVV